MDQGKLILILTLMIAPATIAILHIQYMLVRIIDLLEGEGK